MIALPARRRELRLGSGLVLFAYVAIHFVDHALGLVSLDVAEHALRWSVAIWQSGPGTVLLYGAAAIHVGLALLAVYERRTLRMPAVQALRIALGLTMPVLLIGHAVGTRLATELYELAPTYHRIVWTLWLSDGEGRQLALQAPGWMHGCLGLQIAFGHRRGWQRVRWLLFAAALMLPVLAALGFLAMGRELAGLYAAGGTAALSPPDAAARIALGRLRDTLVAVWFALAALPFAARALRGWIERRRRLLVTIAYPQRTVEVPRGWSVLEASRGFGIAHLSLCGGNARCSTCRVRVTPSGTELPPAEPQERRTLDRIGAPPDVRLACQLRPCGPVRVEPLLDPRPGVSLGCDAAPAVVEREQALLLVGLTGWASVGAGSTAPADAAYATNRLLDVVGEAVVVERGRPARFDSDGARATFDGAGELRVAARQALAAARTLRQRLDALNTTLALELGLCAEYSIVVHVGPIAFAPVGRSGERTHQPVGEAVHAAKALLDGGAAGRGSLIVSRAAAEAAGEAIADAGARRVVARHAQGTIEAVVRETSG